MATEETLEAATINPAPEDNSLRVVTLDNGDRRIFRGRRALCDDGVVERGRMAAACMQIRDFKPRGCTVAIIGGGFGILPRLLWKDYTITVYEIEPRLDRYTPNWCLFVPGDYHSTLSGTFDVIVYDLPGKVPLDELLPHLNVGGLIIDPP